MQFIRNLFSKHWWQFQWKYWHGQTPWDTNITPPEVETFLKTATPGRALDLGCGTGTNAIRMAQDRWQVTGIDFSPRAIHMARRKSRRKGFSIDFRVGDVTRLPPFETPFDYILDIGCLHGLEAHQYQNYAEQVGRLLAPSGTFMLYAWMPRIRNGRKYGLTAEQVHALFAPPLSEIQTVVGEEKGSPTAWYWFRK
jgi:SAM-dependent methyltransferase